MMKTFTTLTAAAAVLLAANSANAADLQAKTKTVEVPPPPSMFDIAFGAALSSNYLFRGISQSDNQPSVSAYFEPRLNFTPNFQAYLGIAGASIDFPNRAAAEIDLYGGIRPTFGKLALDIGGIYYWYPGGECYNYNFDGVAYSQVPGCTLEFNKYGVATLAKEDASFFEVYGKANLALTDAFSIGANIYYTDSYVNTGAEGIYYSGVAKYVFPSFANGVGVYVSGEVGYQDLGTTDDFYGYVSLPSYTTWNAGIGFTYKVFTLDLRYSDTDLSKTDCYLITGDFGANDLGQSKWCGATFLAKLSVDLTLDSLK
nr:TorF family putative porin [Blastochloris tepida]